jgi:alkanesulfonate monooxygenase SsuD/methylene tetrahydromethanopterin reductase-like flavin-dependent oxidoreductase (luciferase family)
MFFTLRFDFRNPPMAGTTMGDRYAAALDMCEWADELGCASVVVSEHHGSPDGYLPSPLMMLAAMAQRTTRMRLMVGALIVPLHDVLRLAEDIIVLDNLSNGRVDLIVAGGYAREEFVMFDVPMNERGRRVTEAVHTLRAAFSGDSFEFRGRNVRITPEPCQPNGPNILMGGGSEPAARRAARIGDGFVPNTPEAWDWYREELVVLGKADPGPFAGGETINIVLAEDPAEGWELMAPYFLHEMNEYGLLQAEDGVASPYRTVDSVEQLRASGRYRIITPDEFVAELRSSPFPTAALHPLCGGMPPALAWESLQLFERQVLPQFQSA